MKERHVEQYTIRGVPKHVGARLRERARKQGRSINSVAIDALAHGLGLDAEVRRFTDLDDLAGSWIDDPEFDRVIADMDRVDEAMWK